MSQLRNANVLVGLALPDDAAVYRVSDEVAIIATVDFFPPVVDDPWTYGAIAAANAMSDVYAMGGEVLFALNVAAFPEDLPVEVVAEVFRGGAEKMVEGGGLVVGGHTIYDREPKYGLCVTGVVHPGRLLAKGGARADDQLLLTKALGTGIILTAAKNSRLQQQAHLDGAIESMLRLNRRASQLIQQVGAHALTDVTGFGLLGHAYEMAQGSGVAIRLFASQVPLLDGALHCAAEGISTGGEGRNRQYLADKVAFDSRVPQELIAILHDPQTSGGLLVALPRQEAAKLAGMMAGEGVPCWRIGEVMEGGGVDVMP